MQQIDDLDSVKANDFLVSWSMARPETMQAEKTAKTCKKKYCIFIRSGPERIAILTISFTKDVNNFISSFSSSAIGRLAGQDVLHVSGYISSCSRSCLSGAP